MSQSLSLPSTQRALRVHQQGGQWQLDTNVPVPQVKENQVLVKVKAVGLNPVDWKLIEYNWFNRGYPQIQGFDLSGTIVALGSQVSDWSIGDEVLVLKNFSVDGSLSEYAVTESFRLARKPAAVSFTDAASLPIAYLSAWEGLVLRAQVNEKDVIYIPGAAGGVGHFAAQIAKLKGARVIASASKEDGIKYLASFLDKEKDLIINYKTQNVAEEISKFTQGQGVTKVYDSLYDVNQYAALAKLLKKGGEYVLLQHGITEMINETSSEELKQIFKDNNLKGTVCDTVKYNFPPYESKAHDETALPLEEAMQWIEKGILKPHVTIVKGLEQAHQGLQKIRQQGVIGKIVVDLA